MGQFWRLTSGARLGRTPETASGQRLAFSRTARGAVIAI
jgi:hypothetical protein